MMTTVMPILFAVQGYSFVDQTRELVTSMLFNPSPDVRRCASTESIAQSFVDGSESVVVSNSLVYGSFTLLSRRLCGLNLLARSPVTASPLSDSELKRRFLLVAAKLQSFDIVFDSFHSSFNRSRSEFVKASFRHKAGPYKYGGFIILEADWRTGDVTRISIGRVPIVANPNVTAVPASVAKDKARQFLAEKFPTKTFELVRASEPLWSDCPMDFHQFLIENPEYRSKMWLPAPDVVMADRERYLTPAADLVFTLYFRALDDSMKLIVTCDGLDGHVIVVALEE